MQNKINKNKNKNKNKNRKMKSTFNNLDKYILRRNSKDLPE